MNKHQKFMQQALELAKLGAGHVLPNPRVGCVIVKNGEVIAKGYHNKYGHKHAEAEAIFDALSKGIDVAGADLYVTLEPCCHFGKQPPCTSLIIEHKIANVYYALEDVDEQVKGEGIKILEQAGVNTFGGIMAQEAYDINEDYFYHRLSGEPLIILKWGTSLDGKLFTYNKKSQWITNEKSREDDHRLRHNTQAIMVGAGTFKIDNPRLNVRLEDLQNPYNPIKIIISSTGKLDLNFNIFKVPENKIIIATTENIKVEQEEKLISLGCTIIKTQSINGQVNLKDLFQKLGKLGIVSILVEGGAQVLETIIANKLGNKVYAYIGAKLIGGKENGILNSNIYNDLQNVPEILLNNIKVFDSDVLLNYDFKDYRRFKQQCLQELLKN